MSVRVKRLWCSTVVASALSVVLLLVGPLSIAAQSTAAGATQKSAQTSRGDQSSDELSYQSAASDAFNKTWERTDKLVAYGSGEPHVDVGTAAKHRRSHRTVSGISRRPTDSRILR